MKYYLKKISILYLTILQSPICFLSKYYVEFNYKTINFLSILVIIIKLYIFFTSINLCVNDDVSHMIESF